MAIRVLSNNRQKVLFRVFFFLYNIFLFFVTIVPMKIFSSKKTEWIESIKIPNLDKAIHFLLFFVFTISYFTTGYHKSRRKYLLWIIPIGTGILIEIIQGITGLGRTFELWDIVADALGVAAAYLMIRFWLEPKIFKSV